MLQVLKSIQTSLLDIVKDDTSFYIYILFVTVLVVISTYTVVNAIKMHVK